jgi:hypothetical protein
VATGAPETSRSPVHCFEDSGVRHNEAVKLTAGYSGVKGLEKVGHHRYGGSWCGRSLPWMRYEPKGVRGLSGCRELSIAPESVSAVHPRHGADRK